jgi:hypothetical protein
MAEAAKEGKKALAHFLAERAAWDRVIRRRAYAGAGSACVKTRR